MSREPSFTADVTRADDQLRLRFEFLDLTLSGGELVAAGADPAIRVVFPPQHLAEDAVSGGVIPGVTAAGERSAHESRVVFQVAPPIPYDLTTLLGFAEWTLAVQGMKGTPPDDVTALELPESLILTPTAGGRASGSGARS